MGILVGIMKKNDERCFEKWNTHKCECLVFQNVSWDFTLYECTSELTKKYQFLHLVLSIIQYGRGICSVMCSLITKEKLAQVFKKCAVFKIPFEVQN
jgi:hypothetical protein